jgi:hypothetical protein
MSIRWATPLVVAGAFLGFCPRLAAQETTPPEARRPWSLELDFIRESSGGALQGTVALPAAPPFLRLALVVPVRTQQVSSRLFGAGAALVNAVNGDQSLASSSLISLDSVLTKTPGTGSGGTGLRVSLLRSVGTRRGSVSVTFDYRPRGAGFSSATRNAIDLTASSFEKAFGILLARFDDPTSSAKVRLSARSASGAAVDVLAGSRFAIIDSRRWVLYASANAGASVLSRDDYDIALLAEDSFSLPRGMSQ